MNLLLGENGTGKTTVFEVLYRLQQFLAGNAKVFNVFPSTELTRWQSSPTQRFELDLSVEGKQYAYSLAIEHDEDRRKARIKKESLLLDGKPLSSSKKEPPNYITMISSEGPNTRSTGHSPDWPFCNLGPTTKS